MYNTALLMLLNFDSSRTNRKNTKGNNQEYVSSDNSYNVAHSPKHCLYTTEIYLSFTEVPAANKRKELPQNPSQELRRRK